MTFDKVSHVADGVQHQIDDQIKHLSRWMKPYAKKMGRLSGDLRPYAEQAIEAARKHPGKTAAGALVLGYLLARWTRR